jgi:Zn-dependent M28 family amino/carboxypeptidase
VTEEAAGARMQGDLAVLLANGPRVSGTPAERAAAEYFARTAARITGGGSTMQPVPLPGDAVSSNVWAAEVGSGDGLLVVGAHLDSVAGAPGADDNGSGLVVTLELLRRLVEHPPSNLRVLVVGFGAEERIGGSGHHFGSRRAVQEMEAGGVLPDLMLSVDMVGVGADLYSAHLDGHDPYLADGIVAASDAAGITVTRRTRGEISDHAAFARAGVPAALLMRGDDPAFHSPADVTASTAALLGAVDAAEALVGYLDGVYARLGARPILP